MPPILLLIPVIALIFFAFYRVKYSRKNKLFAKIPSPKKTFLLHNTPLTFGLSADQLLMKIDSWHHELGDIYHIKLHTFDDGMIFVADTKIAETLSLHQPEREGLLYKPLSRWIGKRNAFLSQGDHMKSRMKIVTPMFSQKTYQRYCKIMTSRIRRVIESGIIEGDNIEFYSFARVMSLDVIFDTAMGYDLNSTFGSNKNYVDAIEEFAELAMKTLLDPLSRYDLLHPFTSLYRRERKVLKVLHELTLKIVKDRRKELESDSEKTNDEFLLLDNFIQTSIKGKRLTDEEVREEMDTIILGGHDTTKGTSAFIIYNLAKYPEVQDKVYEEISLLLGDDVSRDLNEKELNKLAYLEAVIKETLRLFPPVPFVCRKLDSEIRTGGFTFPQDANILISPFLAGRNPKYFDDPLVFNPNRFYGLPTPSAGFIPFSVGVRKCLGGNMAFLLLKIMIAKLITAYKFSLAEGFDEVKLSIDFTLLPLSGIHLRSQKREKRISTYLKVSSLTDEESYD